MIYFKRRCGNRQVENNNPGLFLKGLRSDQHRTRPLPDCCPAKGQPLQESFGVFFCLESADRVLLHSKSGTSNRAYRLEQAQTAFKAAVTCLRAPRGTDTSATKMSGVSTRAGTGIRAHTRRVILQARYLYESLRQLSSDSSGEQAHTKATSYLGLS